MRKQEETRQAEESAKKAEFQAIQSEYEIVCMPNYVLLYQWFLSV